jgi:hypothetical protein
VNEIRISWPIEPPGYRLQYTEGNFITWLDWDTNASPITVEGTNYVAIDNVGAGPRFYRLVKVEMPPPAAEPSLTSVMLNATEMYLAWPTNAVGYRLQFTEGNLTNWTDWNTTTSPINVVGENYVVIDAIGTGLRFYRLIKTETPPPTQQPSLSMSKINDTQILISWPSTFAEYRLQFADQSLAIWTDWDIVASPITMNGGNFEVRDLINPAARFYRLIR